MIEISQLKLPCGTNPEALEKRIREALGIRPDVRFKWKIIRHSVDARKRPVLFDVYSVCVRMQKRSDEEKVLSVAGKSRNVNIRRAAENRYEFPYPSESAIRMCHRPVVIGFGPAGIFCSLMLAREGYYPIVLERGQKMEDRITSVHHFWTTGELNPESNIQFGEGGAGTFSDGKLNSNVKDQYGRIGTVFSEFIQAGAPEEILYEQIPHIGTDRLRGVISQIRDEIISLGGEIRFEEKAVRLIIEDRHVTGILVRRLRTSEEYILPAEAVVLAPGHSARDTMQALIKEEVPMEAKPFAVGFRVSHPQKLINQSRYGISDPSEMRRLRLDPASYKLTFRGRDGRGVYSFCMCPGGYVVNASSERGKLAVNGMSNYRRDSTRANSAIVVAVSPDDIQRHPGVGCAGGQTKPQEAGRSDILSGMKFQEYLEEKAYNLCDGLVPVQTFYSYEHGVTDKEIPSSDELCIKGRSAPGELSTLLPENLSIDFTDAMHMFGRRIPGFDSPDTFVIGLESRTSSPVRVNRDVEGESAVRGLFPCGEGAGFAGGITSAAVDGIRTAEWIGRKYYPPE